MGADLDPTEFGAAFEALSRDDRLKLTLIERSFLGGTTLRTGDLLNEAVCRTLLGRRNCPRHVPVMAFLVETMRSLCSHERAKAKKSVSAADIEAVEARVQVGSGVLPRAPSAEDALIEAQETRETIEMDEILAMFADDKEARDVLDGLGQGLKGKELRDHAGLDQGRLDYAKKRIRKVLFARFSNGWGR